MCIYILHIYIVYILYKYICYILLQQIGVEKEPTKDYLWDPAREYQSLHVVIVKHLGTTNTTRRTKLTNCREIHEHVNGSISSCNDDVCDVAVSITSTDVCVR